MARAEELAEREKMNNSGLIKKDKGALAIHGYLRQSQGGGRPTSVTSSQTDVEAGRLVI